MAEKEKSNGGTPPNNTASGIFSVSSIQALIKTVGLPGFALIALILMLISGKFEAEHRPIWVLIIGTSAIWTVIMWMNNSKKAGKEHADDMARDHSLFSKGLDSLSNVLCAVAEHTAEIHSVISGSMSTAHVQILLPVTIDAFKWRLLTVIIPAVDDIRKNGVKVFDKDAYSRTSEIYLNSLLMPYSHQHVFFRDSHVLRQFEKVINLLFMFIVCDEFVELEDAQRMYRALLQKITVITTETYNVLDDYLNIQYGEDASPK